MRALTVQNVLNAKFNVLSFKDEWLGLIGEPEISGSWIVWGESGHGKTRFVLQLCKYLCKWVPVCYNTLEEGLSESFARAIRDANMTFTKGFTVLDRETIDDLIVRLKRRNSPKVIVIDSLQYSGLTYKEYKGLKDEFRHKLFIWISHAEGRKPSGRLARAIEYDSNVKIQINSFKAEAKSRYGGGDSYIVWDAGYNKSFGIV